MKTINLFFSTLIIIFCFTFSLNGQTNAFVQVDGAADSTKTGISSKINHTATSTDIMAFYGESIVAPGYGIGGVFKGGYIGGRGTADGSNSGITCFGLYGDAIGTPGAGDRYGVYGHSNSSGNNSYGVSGFVDGTGTNNYGIYGKAINGTNNWAGYFDGDMAMRGDNTFLDIISTQQSSPNGIRFFDNTTFTGMMLYDPAEDLVNFTLDANIDGLIFDFTKNRVGVGTKPTYTLDVQHNKGTPTSAIPSPGHGFNIKNKVSATAFWTFYASDINDQDLLIYKNDLFRGQFDGVNGVYTPISDRSLKNNIRPLGEDQMSKIMQLKPSKYHFNHQTDDRNHIGLIAQDVMELYPELAPLLESKEDGAPRNLYGVTYSQFVPVLIAGLQEQYKKVKKLEEKNETLENRIEKLETQSAYNKNVNELLKKQIAQLNEMEERLNQYELDLDDCCIAQNTSVNKHLEISLTGTEEAHLEQNAPNPFQEHTIVNYFLPENFKNAEIHFTDLQGRNLKTIQLQNSGHGAISISAKELAAGTYAYTLIMDGKIIDTKKMILTK